MQAGAIARLTSPRPAVAEPGIKMLDLWTLGRTRSDEADL
jgi:hypothetical protein